MEETKNELDFGNEVVEAGDANLEEYSFTPTVINIDGKEILDYSGIDHTRIFLVNKEGILEKEKPSWIPDIDLSMRYLPIAVKSSQDGCYYVLGESGAVIKMSADVLTAAVDYQLKYLRAWNKHYGLRNTVCLPKKRSNKKTKMETARYQKLVGLLPYVPEYKQDIEIHKYPLVRYTPTQLRQNNIIFDEFRELLEKLKDKTLDMNQAKLDYINSYAKGQDTSYGDNGLDDSLEQKYGINIKKQNGTTFTSQQQSRIENAVASAYEYFGDLSGLARDYKLKVSYADDCNQHASKAIGLFTSYYNAIGVSFFTDSFQENRTMVHELAHWLDYTKGKECNYRMASDKEGTIENVIAEKYKELVKKNTGKKLGDYWFRTCECFARAIEQDFEINCCQDLDRCKPPAYLEKGVFIREIQPLIDELMKENEQKFGLSVKQRPYNQPDSAHQALSQKFNEKQVHPLCYKFIDQLKVQNPDKQQLLSQCSQIYNEIFSSGEPKELSQFRTKYQEKLRFFHDSKEESQALDKFDSYVKKLTNESLQKLEVESRFFSNPPSDLEDNYREYLFQLAVITALICCKSDEELKNRVLMSHLEDMPLCTFSLDYNKRKSELIKVELENRKLMPLMEKNDMQQGFDIRGASLNTEQSSQVFVDNPALQDFLQRFNDGQIHPLCKEFFSLKNSASNLEERYSNSCEIYNKIFAGGEPEQIIQYRKRYEQSIRDFDESPVQKKLLDAFAKELSDLDIAQIQHIIFDQQELVDGLMSKQEEWAFQFIVVCDLEQWSTLDESDLSLIANNRLPFVCDSMQFAAKKLELCKKEINSRELNKKLDELEVQHMSSSATKKLREKCRQILAEKSDNEITDEDKQILRSYTGAGGLHEKGASSGGVLYEFYTPQVVVDSMWRLADAYAPQATTVLEPAAGIGGFAVARPTTQKFTMYEVDETAARINKILHPEATVINQSFQRQFFDAGERVLNKKYVQPKFDLVIGNPPYGDYKDKWRGLGEGVDFQRYEEYFLSRGIDALKDDSSAMVMIVPSGFINSSLDKAKSIIAGKGQMVDAWRLPEGIFSTTKIGTDILVFKKGSCDPQQISDGKWFKDNPHKILGEVRQRVNRFGREEEYVYFNQHDQNMSLVDLLKKIVPDVKSIDNSPKISTNTIEETLQEVDVKEATNATDSSGIHQGYDGREANLRGKGVAGYANSDRATLHDESEGNRATTDGSRGHDVDSPSRGSVQQSLSEHDGPAFEGNDSPTSRSIGNVNSEQSGVGTHGKKLRGSAEQLPDRLTAKEFSEYYTGANFSQEEYPILLATDWKGRVDLQSLNESQKQWLSTSDKYIEINKDCFVNRSLFCSGNIYDKLNKLEETRHELSSEIYYHKQKEALLSVLPEKKTLDQVEISLLGDIAKSFMVTRAITRNEIRYVNDVEEFVKTTNEEQMNLVEDFISWATGYLLEDSSNGRHYISNWVEANISREDLPDGIRWNDIVEYIDMKSVKADRSYTSEGKAIAKAEAESKRENRKITAEMLFNRYLRENLPAADKDRLINEWNRRFNGYVAPDYSKMPVLVDGMTTVKDGKPFKLYDQQVRGVAFLTQKGNGLLAYDVGVGKTATGIVATVSQIQSKRSKRPLIVVPNSVYTKWIDDFTKMFPNVPLIELGNFSPKAIKQYDDGNHGLLIPEGSVSICTNEALMRLTFEDSSIKNELFDDFSYLLGKSDEVHSENDKERAKACEAIAEKIGKTAKTKDGYIFFERCGFDHVTVDEAHRFKNLFRTPRSSKPDSKGQSQEFSGIGSGEPSNRALKLFAITQMIQRKNNDRNVFMLTATPFTNSPLEIYSMLSYIGRQQLVESNIYDIRDFLNEFANVINEWSVDATGTIKPKSVMKSFRNPHALQALIMQYIDKVDGEEAGIIRPDKEQHQLQFEMTEIQQKIVDHELERMTSAESKNNGGVLVAMNNMRMAMVSPALLDSNIYPEIEDFPTDVVASSPKLTYVCDTVAQVWKEKKECGQVIYMPYGVDQIDAVKTALVSRGIPEDSIGIMRPGDNMSEEKTDKLRDQFNDKNHPLKVLIGSKKIAEGIDLNGNSIALYNTMLDWNPTDRVQVEGRIWRQGNRQERVHIVYPLMQDSIESLLFQKQDEKSNRINDLFSYKGDDALDVSSINPEELKFDLIRDPWKRADFIIEKMIGEVEKDKSVIEKRIKDLGEIKFKKNSLQEQILANEQSILKYQQALDYPEQREPWWTEAILKNWIKTTRHELSLSKSQFDTVLRRMEKMGFANDQMLEDYHQSLVDKLKELNKKINEIEKSKEQIIEQELNKVAVSRAMDSSFEDKVNNMAQYIIEHTREKVDNKISEKSTLSVEKTPSIESNSDILASSQKDKSLDGHVPSETTTQDDEKGIKDNLEKYQNATLVQNELDLFGDVELPSPSQTDKAEEALADEIWNAVTSDFESKYKDFFNSFLQLKDKFIENPSSKEIEDEFQPSHHKMLNIQVEEIKKMVAMSPSEQVAKLLAIRYINFNGDDGLGQGNLFDYLGISKNISPKGLHQFISKLYLNSRSPKEYKWVQYEDGNGHIESPDKEISFIYDSTKKAFKTYENSPVWVPVRDEDIFEMANEFVLGEYPDQYISFVEEKRLHEQTKEDKTLEFNYFVRDTSEYEAFESFEPVVGLSAVEAVKLYLKMHDEGKSPGIGINIPGDLVFNDPNGLGVTILVKYDGVHDFGLYGDSFIESISSYNDRAKTLFKAYRGLLSELESSGVEVRQPQFLFDKEKQVMSTSEAVLDNQKIEQKFWNLADMLGQENHYIKLDVIKPNLNQIAEEIRSGNSEIIQMVSDFDSVKENHVKNDQNTFGYDILHKLFQNCNNIVQKNIKASFERDKIPYVFLHWSESAVFPFENSCYAIKDFDRIIADEDRYRNNEKERLRQKYGSSDKYYSIPRKELPPEDRNASFGYDKTKFSIYNLPTLDKRDTISYGPDRYDIGDGYGGLFNYIRRSCSHQGLVKAMDNLEQEIYFSSLSGNDRNEMRSIIANERSTLVNILHGKLNTFGNLWVTKQEKAEALQGIKDAVYESLENILGKAKSSGISGDYAINETQKFLDNIIYGVMALEDDREQSREIWKQFPNTCNYKELLKGIYEQQPNPRQVSQDYNLPKFYIIKENHSRYDDQGKDYFLFSSLEKAEQYAQEWKEDIENEWEDWSRKNTYYDPEVGEYIPEDVERPEKPENTSYEVEAVDFDDDRVKHLIASGSCLEEDKKYFEKISQMLGQPSVQDNEKSPRNTDAVDQAFIDKIRGYLGSVELETLPLTDQMKQDEVQNLYAVNSNGQRYGFIYTKLSTGSNIRIVFQDMNSDAVELDDFPSSVSKINLAREYIARGIGKGIYADIIIPPKEAWTRDDQKYNEVVAIGKTVSSPRTSWWGKIENKKILLPGVYFVSTARHGGLMVHESVADLILSKEAQQVASYEKGFYQFEEDSAISVPLFELYQRGLYEGADELTKEKKDELFVTNQESILLYELEYAKKAFPILNRQKTLDENSHFIQNDMKESQIVEEDVEQREKENIELLTRFMGNPSLVTLINNHIPTDDVAIVFNYETTLSDLKEMFTLDSEVEQRFFGDKDDNVRLEYKVHQGQIVDRTLVATKDGKNYHLNFDFNFKNVKSKDELILDLIKKHFASINNGLDFTMKGWAVQWLENHTDGLDSYRINNNHDYFLSGKAIELRAERGKDLMKSFIIENWDKNLDKDELISKAFDDVFDQHSVIIFNPKLKEYSFKYRENIDVYTSAEQQKMEEANKYLMDQVREWGQLFYDDYKINHPQVQQLDSNADFVLNKASSGMLAKYIDRSEISEIDQFREYAAQRVSGDAQDKSYFDQMWNLGKEFCRQMGWPEAPLPLEMEGKPLVDIPDMPSFDLNQVEIPSMPMGDVVETIEAEISDNICLSLENIFIYQENKRQELGLLDEMPITFGTIRKSISDGTTYYDLYNLNGNLICCDSEVVNVLKHENGIYYLDNNNNDSLETNNFIKLTDEEFNVATKKHSVKDYNMTHIQSMPLFEPRNTKLIPFDIINNEEKARVNIKFNPKKRVPAKDFNEIIHKLKSNGWRFSKSGNQWYPFGSAIHGSKEFAEGLQQEYTRTVHSFDIGSSEEVQENKYSEQGRYQQQSPEPKLVYFDRYGNDLEEFLAYFNSHLDQLKIGQPINEEQAATIFNSIESQRFIMPQSKTNRLGVDEQNNLFLVHQEEGNKTYNRMTLPDLIMYGLETMSKTLISVEENLNQLNSKDSLSVLENSFKRSYLFIKKQTEETLSLLNEICDIYLLGKTSTQDKQKIKELSVGDELDGYSVIQIDPLGKGVKEVHVSIGPSDNDRRSFFLLDESTKEKINPQLHQYLEAWNGRYKMDTGSRVKEHLMKELIDKRLCPPREKSYYEKLVKHSIAWPLEYEVLYPVDKTNFKERFQQMIEIHGGAPKNLLPFSAKLMNYVKPEDKKDLSNWLATEQGFSENNAVSKILSKWVEEKMIEKTKRNGYPPRGES